MGKLSQFSGIKSSAPSPEDSTVKEKTNAASTETEEKLVTVNIKISRSQHQWLNETARTVRDNNDEPVPPSERVFPQHLIGVAVDLLQREDIDWSQVRNVAELREQLNL
ncbi:hypothetical protein IQ257_28905 [Coleofasciculus sp. LEGE 07092]|nr:hypothetical protein [Coleofasciculus sp. LEGE 07081]MBE9152427.1 hypothetical protein [Coleofasciculus sp. LEGE 07092]